MPFLKVLQEKEEEPVIIEPITPEPEPNELDSESDSKQESTPEPEIIAVVETVTPDSESTQENPAPVEPVTPDEPAPDSEPTQENEPTETTPEEPNESDSKQENTPEPEIIPVVETVTQESESTQEDEPAPEPESEPTPDNNKYSGDDIKYDVTSGKRYVDLVSTKTDFDRMLDELAAISKDIIEHEAERFAKKYTGKFQGDFDKAEADAKKYDAFLGGYITNAAMLLYDRGHREVAIAKLEETRKVLEARKKLEDETAAIKTRVEEEDAVVDLSDILGLFGDG